MNGTSHMILGASLFVAGARAAPALVGGHETPGTLVAGAVVASGAALLPDLDTTNSTLAHAFWPVTWPAAMFTSRVFGGHRHGTHSVVFCVLATAGSAVALALSGTVDVGSGHRATATVGAIFAGIVCCCAVLLVLGKVRVPRGGIARMVVAVAVVAFGARFVHGVSWLPVAVGLGCLSHLLADALTPEGIEPAWPLTRHRVGVPLVRSPSAEVLFVAACAAGALVISGLA